MSYDDEEVVEDNQTDVEEVGKTSYVPTSQDTLDFVTIPELLKLLSTRYNQLSSSGSLSMISPKILEKYGEDADIIALLIAEISDETIEYPLAVMRGNMPYRIHFDLKISKSVLDIIILTNENGHVSYNFVLDDIKNNPKSEKIAHEKDFKHIEELAAKTAKMKLI